MITLKRHFAPAMATASLLLIAGCVPQHATLDDAIHEPANPSEAYPITVAKGPQTLEVSTRQGSLQPSQINAVSAFVNSAMSAGVTPIHVLRPSGGGNSARVASEVVNLMAQAGVPRNRVMFGTYRAPASAPVRLSFISTYARTKKCGVWPEDITDYHSNNVMPNEGCAVQANIAAMTANPQTFIVPVTPSPVPGSQAASAVAALGGGSTASSSASSGGSGTGGGSSSGGSGSGSSGGGNP
jgi:pilus assembly protein CpaD